MAEENSEAESSATEAESSENVTAEEWETLKKESYELDQVQIDMALSQDIEKAYHLSVGISSEVEWKLAYSFIIYQNVLAVKEFSVFNPIVFADNEEVTLTSTGFSFAKEGGALIDTGEWCAE